MADFTPVLNDIYGFQDKIILCKIFENSAKEMTKIFPYNPQKCTSASLLKGYIHCYLSKAIISLPKQAEIVDLFEQALIGGFSCIKTRLLFDSKILLPKNSCSQLKENLKIIYKTKTEMKNIFENKRVVSKILKMDENSQYGNVMTKPLPTGSIKKMKKISSLKELDLVRQGILEEDKIGHLFEIDIEFDKKNADEKQLFFNEIYIPIFEKKVLSANGTSVFQLLDAMRLNNKRTINSYKTTAKTHATMDKKFDIPLYAKYLHFLLSRCGWRVSNVRAHYTFEQSEFKKEFVIMNQVSRQNARTDVEKDFYRLMKNSNFGYDCSNSADNCFLFIQYPIYSIFLIKT